jgi:hypothetical protein
MADRPPSPEDEDDAFWRSQVILDADDEKAEADLYPRLFNISTGMIYMAVLRTQDPEPAEYVTIPLSSGWGDEENRLHMAATRWNMQWEAAQFRRRIFREDDLVLAENLIRPGRTASGFRRGRVCWLLSGGPLAAA